jgi:hypothetical protein
MNPFNIILGGGAYSSRSNLNWYTLLGAKPRASLVRFLWSVKTLIDCPHSIPLNSFSAGAPKVHLYSTFIDRDCNVLQPNF